MTPSSPSTTGGSWSNAATTTSQPTTAVARKLACRAWAIATTGRPYQPRDLDGNPLSLTDAATLAVELAVPDNIRSRTRGHTRQGRLKPT